MDLETVIQSEVSQKEKNKYRILTHICGIQKYGTDEPVSLQGRNSDTDVENKRMDTKGGEAWGGGGGDGMNWEIGIDMYTLICVKQITNKILLYKK